MSEEKLYEENARAIETLGAAAAPLGKVSKLAVKNACKTLMNHIKKIYTIEKSNTPQKNVFKMALSNQLNKAAKNLYLLITKALGSNGNARNKMNDDLQIGLLSLNTDSPVIHRFLTKGHTGFDIENRLEDRMIFYRMLQLIQQTLANATNLEGGRRRSKKQRKQKRRHTRRQK